MSEIATPLQVRAPAPGVAVIEISGEVTRESDLALQDAYERASEGSRSIILDGYRSSRCSISCRPIITGNA